MREGARGLRPGAAGVIVLLAVLAPVAESTVYRTGTWDADLLGNHRAVVRVTAPADAVLASLPWRRRDPRPQLREVLVVDGATGQTLANVARASITRESGDIVFQPRTVPGDYYVYYMPAVSAGSPNYPTVVYPRPRATADDAWLRRHRLDPDDLAAGAWKALPRTELVAFESIDDFNSPAPMNLIATRDEVESLLKRHATARYLVFPEDRRHAIRMTDDLPAAWAGRGASTPFRGEARRGEYFVFQVGIWAARADLDDVRVALGEFRSLASGAAPGSAPPIDAATFTCFNQAGVDWMGRAFTRRVSVERGKVQAFWCGVQVPASAGSGQYRAALTVSAHDETPTTVDVTLDVGGEPIPSSGDDEPWRLSRLRWLDSTLAHDTTVIAPYEPVKVEGLDLRILGRRVSLGLDGLPAGISSHFAPEMTSLADTSRQVLSGPVALVVDDLDRKAMPFTVEPTRITSQAPGRVAWESVRSSGRLRMHLEGALEADGTMEFEVALSSDRPVPLGDVRLEVPVSSDVARYVMGLGLKGGARPASFEWKWDARKNQDAIWIGDVNAGLQVSLKDDKYVRPLNTNFYLQKPLVMPASWHNGGRGGCRLAERLPSYVLTCDSGARTLEPGETLRFDFRILLTPFRTLDTRAQFSTRFYHRYTPLDDVTATGANVVNVHHATAINPWINYPFLRPDDMKAYVDEAHARKMKVKIYYTVRELSNRAPELFALRSLGDEVLAGGPGGGFSWLQEHLGSDYIAAWFVPEIKDAAVINSGVSRWHNYYVEGLAWLVRNVGIDGLYIDDVAFDRTTMKRVRKVLDRGRPGALIDLHSANQYNVRDGFASSANLYLEHFPYLDRLWFGEYFDYDARPDYWLVEMSGIPFGLMGEMLEGGGNPWRGMVFGMTSRLPWAGDPRPLWRAWDDFGIVDSRMIGWWVPNHPVKTGHPDVLATAFVKDGGVMVALASWASQAVDVRLDVDWVRLGLAADRVALRAPAIDGFQSEARYQPGDAITVEPGKGLVLIAASTR